MENEKRVYSLLGLAMKAGKIAAGSFLTEKSVKEARANLVIVAKDASDNTRKQFTDMCTYYHVPLVVFGNMERLGAAVGRAQRAAMAVNDAGFANALAQRISNME